MASSALGREAFNAQSVAEDVDFYHRGFENFGDLKVQKDCGQVKTQGR